MADNPRLYYPAFLDIMGKPCLVVGGGKVAERKVLGLLRAGASVTVISPSLTKPLDGLKAKEKIRHIERTFKKSDLRGSFLVIAATDSPEENAKIASLKDRLPVNVVDKPELCSFIVPSVVRRGPLQIAISTSGASPAMAKAIRLELEKLYGPEFGRYLRKAGRQRKKAIAETDAKERARFLKSLGGEKAVRELRRSH